MKKISVKVKYPKDSNWVTGSVGDYKFEATLFDEGSSYGINNGRVSKFHMWNAKKGSGVGDVVAYERGWDQKPNRTIKPYYDAVMVALESSPKRFE